MITQKLLQQAIKETAEGMLSGNPVYACKCIQTSGGCPVRVFLKGCRGKLKNTSAVSRLRDTVCQIFLDTDALQPNDTKGLFWICNRRKTMDAILWLVGIVVAYMLLVRGHRAAGSFLLGVLSAIALLALGSRRHQ